MADVLNPKINTVERTIYYYELSLEYYSKYKPSDTNKFRDFFSNIAKLAQTKDELRYQEVDNRILFVQGVFFDQKERIITGKILSIRKDDFPELIDFDSDEVTGIEAGEQQGIVETTHFVIDYTKKPQILAIEYNSPGAKYTDFIRYCEIIGDRTETVKKVGFAIVVKDELQKIKNKIARCSELLVRVYKEKIDDVEEVDGKIFAAMSITAEQFETEYAEIRWKFDYTQYKQTQEVSSTINKIIGKFIKRKENMIPFNKLTIKAEDSQDQHRIREFDLLVDKVSSKVNVQKKEKYRTIISVDMFDKMRIALKSKNL